MRKVVWTTTASLEYAKNIEYLISKWSETEAGVFIGKVDSLLADLKSGLIECPFTKRGNIHKCVVCKQVSLLYHIDEKDNLVLPGFWNNYQGNL